MRLPGTVLKPVTTPWTSAAPADARGEARQGLADADGFYLRFWNRHELRAQAAENALRRMARHGDRDADSIAALALKTPALPAKTRLHVLRGALSAIESGASGSVTSLAGLAVSWLGGSGFHAAHTASAAYLAHLSEQAAQTHDPMERYATLLASLAPHAHSCFRTLAALSMSPASCAAQFAQETLQLHPITAATLFRASAPAVQQMALERNDPGAEQRLAIYHELSSTAPDGQAATLLALDVLRSLETGGRPSAYSVAHLGRNLANRVAPGERPRVVSATLDCIARLEQRDTWSGDWLRHRDDVESALAGAPGAAEVRSAVLDHIAGGSPPQDLAAMSTVVDAAAKQQPADPQGCDTLQRLLGVAERTHGSRHPAVFAEIHALMDGLPKLDGAAATAQRYNALRAGIFGLWTAALYKNEFAFPFARNVAAALLKEEQGWRDNAPFLLAHAQNAAWAAGKRASAEVADAARRIAAKPDSDDLDRRVVLKLLESLNSQPTSLADCVKCAEDLTEAKAEPAVTRRAASAMADVLHRLAVAERRPSVERNLRLLERLVDPAPSEADPVATWHRGFKRLLVPSKGGSDVALFAQGLHDGTPPAAARVNEGALAAIAEHAQAEGQDDLKDVADLLTRVSRTPSLDPQLVTDELRTLGASLRTPLSVGATMLDRTSGSARHAVAAVTLDVLEAAAARRYDPAAGAQARFIRTLHALAGPDAVVEALRSLSQRTKLDGDAALARVALDVHASAGAANPRILQAALDELSHGAASGTDRAAFLHAMQQLVSLHGRLLHGALEAVATREGTGLSDFSAGLLEAVDDTAGADRALDLLRAEAERRGDDTLVRDIIAAETGDALHRLRAASHRIARLEREGACFLPRRVDSPGIERTPASVVIGGVTIPRR